MTFGFHLHNAIPGFPVPKFDLTEPSYELVKSQQWDDIPVRNKKQNYEKVINGLLVSCLPIFNQTTLVKSVPKQFLIFFYSFQEEKQHFHLCFCLAKQGSMKQAQICL